MKIKVLAYSLFAFSLYFFLVSPVKAATCNLVDPGEGMIEFTCKHARLEIDNPGTRSLPHPGEVSPNTTLDAYWVGSYNNNTWIESWDAANQTSHFWTYENGDWINIPENAILQQNGSNPHVLLQSINVGGGQWGWAVIEIEDLLLWNGGN